MRYALFIFAVIFLVGCVSPFDIVIVTEEIGPKDVIVIKEIGTIPSSPLQPDKDVALFLVIENSDSIMAVQNISLELFNPSSFRIVDSSVQSIEEILPGEQKQIEINLISPSESDIAGVRHETDLQFRVMYEFEGSTDIEVLIVNEAEARSRRLQEQPIKVESRNIISSGPIQVEVKIEEPSYIAAGKQRAGTFFFRIVNKGNVLKGDLKNGRILVGKFKIEFPEGIGIIRCPEEFVQEGLTCTNKEDILLFRGESDPIRVDIINSPQIEAPFRTHTVNANVKYTYELRDSAHVTVVP